MIHSEFDILSMFSKDTGSHLQALDTFYGRKGVLDPEKALMAAILIDAISDLEKFKHDRKRRFHEAFKWLNNTGSDWVFSFVFICESLGLDPQCVRDRVTRRIGGDCHESLGSFRKPGNSNPVNPGGRIQAKNTRKHYHKKIADRQMKIAAAG